jgi:hypothetical protein
MPRPRSTTASAAPFGASQVVGEPVLFKDTVLRLVKDSSGGWVETWNGFDWVKPASGPGPATHWVSGRRMTDAELAQRGIRPPSGHRAPDS